MKRKLKKISSLLFLCLMAWGGQAHAAPTLTTNPANGGTLEFGNVGVGGSSTLQVSVSNSGTGNVTGITADLTTGTVFQIASNNCATQQAGDPPCIVEVTFSPIAAGLIADTLTIGSNNGGSSTITVQGTGVDAVAGEIDPTDHDFGLVGVGLTSSDQIFTVTSTGNLNLEITSVDLSDPVNFSILLGGDQCTGQILAQSEECEITVVCNPTMAGMINGTLTVNGSGLGAPLVADLTCEGENVPLISVDPTDVDFGAVEEGTTSAAQTVTVTNDGTDALTLGILSLNSGANFSIVNNNCDNSVLDPAETCTVGVEFSPNATGPFNDELNVPSDAANESNVSIALTGTGISATEPVIQINPAGPIDFGNVGVGNSSSAVNVQITNVGGSSSTLNIGALGLTNSANFSIANNNCSSANLDKNESCNVGLVFNPQAEGAINGALNVPSDAVSGPDSVALTGTGISPANPVLTVEPTSVNFGNVVLNTKATQTVTVKNTGDQPLVIGDAALSGSTAFSFEQDNCSGETLLANEECTIILAVLFNQLGAVAGELEIPSNDPLGSALVALAATIVKKSGGGCALSAAAVPLSQASSYLLGVLVVGGFAFLRRRS